MSDYQLIYFKPEELADKETGIVKLAPGNMQYPGFGPRIDAIRRAWGGPLVVNSCCRTKERNERIGGHPKSLHVYDHPFHPTGGAAAIDFRLFPTEDENEMFKQLAMKMGFSVGDEAGTIHCDDRTMLLGMPQVRFTYHTKIRE